MATHRGSANANEPRPDLGNNAVENKPKGKRRAPAPKVNEGEPAAGSDSPEPDREGKRAAAPAEIVGETSSEPANQSAKGASEAPRKARSRWKILGRVLEVAVVTAAVGILISTFFLSVLQIRGTSMEPTFHDGDLAVATHSKSLETGDIVAFYYNNKVLLKRVVGFPGDWIDFAEDGRVIVNGEKLDESYVLDPGEGGNVDITFPYQVPEGRYFVLGDHRSTSIDSRSEHLGTVAEDQVLGTVKAVVWPLTHVTWVD